MWSLWLVPRLFYMEWCLKGIFSELMYQQDVCFIVHVISYLQMNAIYIHVYEMCYVQSYC